MNVWGVVGLQEKVLRGEEAMQLIFAVDKEGVIFGISGMHAWARRQNRVKGNWTLSELWGEIGREGVGDVGWKGSGPDVPIPTVKIIRSCFQLFYITVRFFKAVILLLLKLKNNVAFLFMSFSWLRRRWNSPVIIVGAEDKEYQLTIEDIDSSLVFMYIL